MEHGWNTDKMDLIRVPSVFHPWLLFMAFGPFLIPEWADAYGLVAVGGAARGMLALGDRSLRPRDAGLHRRRIGLARAHRAAGQEQCEERGRGRRGNQSSSHALTVWPGQGPMSGLPLGVRSRSGCASL